MPLSEHEQRLLEQMERALYAEDPKFATQLRSASGLRGSRTRAVLGVLAVLGGLGLVLGGVATELVALGVAGFAVMLVGAVVTYGAFQRPVGAESADQAPEQPAARRRGKPSRPGFMDRMEDRWRRRTDEDGR